MKEKQAAKPDIEIWMWLPGLLVVVFAAMLIMHVQFSMPLLEAAVALILSFSMSLVAIQATGATGTPSRCVFFVNLLLILADTTPINAISKVSQIALGSITRASGASVEAAQRLNLVGASITNIGACQACGKFANVYFVHRG